MIRRILSRLIDRLTASEDRATRDLIRDASEAREARRLEADIVFRPRPGDVRDTAAAMIPPDLEE